MNNKSPLYSMVLVILSVYVLVALLLEAFWIEDPEIKAVLQYLDFMVCMLFLWDFFVCLFTAESKRIYMKWGWIDLLSSIPAIDPLRWGRISKVVRIIRYLRAIKSLKIIVRSVSASRFETLSICVFLVVFISFTLSAAFILEFERSYESGIDTAESALAWALLNIVNAKTSISQALSPEGIFMTVFLNKVGLLIFAYLNSMIVAWLVLNVKKANTEKSVLNTADDGT